MMSHKLEDGAVALRDRLTKENRYQCKDCGSLFQTWEQGKKHVLDSVKLEGVNE